MAAGGGEDDATRRRFPCLAVARYVVAAVVTVLAVVVIVMVVLVVLLRPDDISLSVAQGRVGATDLWEEEEAHQATMEVNLGGGGAAAAADAAAVVSSEKAADGRRGRAAGAQETVGSVVGTYRPETTAYVAAGNVTLDLKLRADNPSGRAEIGCTDIAFRLLDMPNGPANSTGMTQIAAAWPNAGKLKAGFKVKQKSSHTLWTWALINDTAQLSYIADTYGGRSGFPAMLWVTLNATSITAAHTVSAVVTHYCGPLTVGTDRPSADAPPLQCTRSDQGQGGLFRG